MCRHLCYLGRTPITLRELLFDPPRSLVHQSYSPCDMRGGGTVNCDGFGAGWYAGGDAVRYRRAGPIWQDAGFAELAGRVSSSTVLAAVRNATVGMPVTETAAAPFTDGRWLFSLNGRIDGWPDAALPVAGTVPVRSLLTMDAPTDAALLWSVLRHRLGRGAEPGTALAELASEVLGAAPDSRLNLLLTDGHRAYATTVTHSLSVRQRPTVIASEPLDGDQAWQPVPDRRLVVADRDGYRVEELVA
ncbi:MAG TPA: ergothioneine biosynthesis protein EgtC [Jatrophihabitans sp.]|nr:ergothioneine biosynthesis protein EgtC [Jatrophihabitans sp.]